MQNPSSTRLDQELSGSAAPDNIHSEPQDHIVPEQASIYKTIFEHIRDGVFVHRMFENGKTGRFELVNPAACRMSGYTEEELLGMGPEDLHPQEDMQAILANCLGGLEKNRKCLFDAVLLHKDGYLIDAEISVTMVANAESDYIITTVHDVTLRNRAYRDLAESKSRLQLIMDAAHAGIWEWNTKTDSNIWTDELFRLYGLDKDCTEASYDAWLKSILPEEREETERVVIEAARKAEEFTIEWQVRQADGAERWLMSKGTPFKDEEGEVSRYVGIVIDITMLKLAQKAEIKEQSFRKAVIESIPGTFYMIDIEGRYAAWNAYQRDVIIGKPEYEMREAEAIRSIHPEDRVVIQKKITNVLEEGTVEIAEGRVLLCGGPAFRWFLMTGRRIVFDGKPYLIGIGIDITDRKRIEDMQSFLARITSLPASDSFFSALARYLADCLGVDVVHIGRFERDGSAMTTLGIWSIGYDTDEISDAAWNMLPAAALDENGTCIHLSGVRDLFPQDRLFQDLRAESYIAATLFDHNGQSIGIIRVIGRGLLENGNLAETIIKLVSMRLSGEILRIEAEKALQKSEKKYRELYETLPIGLYQSDLGGRIITANECCLQIARADKEDRDWWLMQDTRESYVDPEDALRLRELLMRDGYVSGFESRFKRRDGTIAWLSNTATLVYNEKGEADFISGSFIDITERKLAEEAKEKLEIQLQQSQKMELVGRLAGGIAHDFNNMLGVILGNAELALASENLDPANTEHIEEVVNAANRSANLTGQLLAFARKQTVTPKIVELNILVEGMLNMLRRLIGEDINLCWQPCTLQLFVNIDPSQIDQILVNLCVNARDAIVDVGTVTIETGARSIDETDGDAYSMVTPGEYVMLAVTDTGCGIEKQHFEHIFEPFFTTKEIGKGTGLGLSTVYGIVKQNNGFINLESQPGKGASFRIYLPHVVKTLHQPAEDQPVSPVVQGKGTILLVEDEPEILKLCRMVLEKIGYSVFTANTPEKALQIAEEHGRAIHLLLTDVIMPEMNGRDLAFKLHSIQPEMKVIYMSGYTADNIASHGVIDTDVQFIQKPFSINTLRQKVCNVLEGNAISVS
ncbi:PAS domain S-box protein [Chlorobium limicola]